MADLELVPLTEVDIEKTAIDLYACLQVRETKAQLKRYLPGPLGYGESIESSEARLRENQRVAREDNRFRPFIQKLGEHAVGMAVLDSRLEAYRRRLMAGVCLGRIVTSGPNTSSWIAAPYQGNGYGRLSLEMRLKIATEDNHEEGVWTVVDNENITSKANVLNRGFVPVYAGTGWVAGQAYVNARVYQYRPDAPAS